jgi:hypothetical protein
MVAEKSEVETKNRGRWCRSVTPIEGGGRFIQKVIGVSNQPLVITKSSLLQKFHHTKTFRAI